MMNRRFPAFAGCFVVVLALGAPTYGQMVNSQLPGCESATAVVMARQTSKSIDGQVALPRKIASVGWETTANVGRSWESVDALAGFERLTAGTDGTTAGFTASFPNNGVLIYVRARGQADDGTEFVGCALATAAADNEARPTFIIGRPLAMPNGDRK